MKKTGIFHRQTAALREPRNLGPLADLLSIRFRRVDILLTRGFANQTDVSSGIISCLAMIVGNPGISQNELAHALGVDKSIIVALMHELEARGWARRFRSEQDRRRHELRATEQGRSELDRMTQRVKRFEDTLLQNVPAGDLEALRELLDRMYASCLEHLEEAERDAAAAEPTAGR